MKRTERFLGTKNSQNENTETFLWILWIFACLLGGCVWKPAIWFVFVPVLKFIMFGDWKKENDNINKNQTN